jgi:DNA repair protein RecO (recombination protein O)
MALPGCVADSPYGTFGMARESRRELWVSQERTEAVVLRGVDFSETSRVVSFLSPDRGRLACMAKGVRRRNSPMAAVLDTFNLVELVYYWKDGREVQTLAEASMLDGFTGIKRDLMKMAFAAFPLELAGKAAHDNEPSHELFAVLVRGLRGLDVWTGVVPVHAAWQALSLLAAAGFEPSLDTCALCGARVNEAYGFSMSGGVTCGACPPERRLSAAQFDALRTLMCARETCANIGAVPGLCGLLSAYAAHQLETEFRSMRVIAEMFG